MLDLRSGADRKSTNGARLTFLFVLIGVTVALWAVSVVILRGPGGCSDITCARNNSARPGAQVLLQSSIVNDRKHLFNGVLSYSPLDPMPVEQTQVLNVELIGVGKNPQAFLDPIGKVVGSRSLQVGGVEGADLSIRGGGALISPEGPTRGLIGQPGDAVFWTWDIKPMEPGEHTLDLVVVTYQGTSDIPLFVVNPPIQIKLSVTDTWSHRTKSAAGWIIGFSAFIVAVGAIFTFFREQVFAVLSKMVRRKTTAPAAPADNPPGADASADSDHQLPGG